MKAINREEIKLLVPRKHIENFKLPNGFDQINWTDVVFLGWIHPSGHIGYILEDLNSYHRLWIFNCNNKIHTSKKAKMCSICYSIHSGTNPGVRMFSREKDSKKNVTLGRFICGDLNCNKWVTVIKANSMTESLSLEDKKIRMLTNLDDFLITLI